MKSDTFDVVIRPNKEINLELMSYGILDYEKLGAHLSFLKISDFPRFIERISPILEIDRIMRYKYKYYTRE